MNSNLEIAAASFLQIHLQFTGVSYAVLVGYKKLCYN